MIKRITFQLLLPLVAGLLVIFVAVGLSSQAVRQIQHRWFPGMAHAAQGVVRLSTPEAIELIKVYMVADAAQRHYNRVVGKLYRTHTLTPATHILNPDMGAFVPRPIVVPVEPEAENPFQEEGEK